MITIRRANTDFIYNGKVRTGDCWRIESETMKLDVPGRWSKARVLDYIDYNFDYDERQEVFELKRVR